MAPSGLYARLCHAFLVLYTFLRSVSDTSEIGGKIKLHCLVRPKLILAALYDHNPPTLQRDGRHASSIIVTRDVARRAKTRQNCHRSKSFLDKVLII